MSSFAHFTAATAGSQITAVPGARLKSLTVNTAVASATATIYDTKLTVAGIPGGAAVIAVVDASVAGTKFYDINVINGVSVVVTGTADITVVVE